MGEWDDFSSSLAPELAPEMGQSGSFVPAISGLTGGDNGGIWSGLKDAASNIWGTAGTKTQEGTGVLGGLDTFGNVAKAVMPVASIGTGIAGFINQQRAMEQLKRQGKMTEQGAASQLESAQQARPYAASAAALAPDIHAVADRVAPLADRASTSAQSIRDVAGSLRSGVIEPTQSFALERLTKARNGEIPPAMQAQLARLEAGELQQMRDYLSRSGLGDSSSMQQAESMVKERSQARAAKYLQDEEAAALGALEQVRAGAATEGSLYGQEAATLGAGANILGSQVNDLARGGEQLGIAGNILNASGRNAGQSTQSAQAEQQALEQMMASTNRFLASLSGSTGSRA